VKLVQILFPAGYAMIHPDFVRSTVWNRGYAIPNWFGCCNGNVFDLSLCTVYCNHIFT
jgi:hypothetical protein